jgi:prevent-host-death family protein
MARNHKKIRKIAVSEFKAKCLALLQEVDRTKTPVRVTRRGHAIADVVPIAPDSPQRDWMGSMSGTATLVGDIVGPVIDMQDFEAAKD